MASNPDSRTSQPPVGQRVRLLRQERGLTQTELARQIGIQQSDLSRMEKGEYRIPLDVLFRLLRVFRVNISEFFEEPGAGNIGTGEQEVLRIFRSLPPSAQEEVLEFLHFKCSRMMFED